MTSSGTNHQFLADYGNYPDWHPEGSSLIYIGWFDSTRGGIIKFNLQTGNRTLLFDGQSNDTRHPVYSPDGSKIALASSPSPTGTNIWIMNSNGSDLHQVTNKGVDADFGIPFTWSLAGDKIVYTRYQSTDWTMNNGVLWLLDIQSGMETPLTFNP